MCPPGEVCTVCSVYRVWSIHCAMCIPCTLYRVPCAVYRVLCTMYTVCNVYGVQCVVCIPCTVYRVPCTVYRVSCTVYSVQCVLCQALALVINITNNEWFTHIGLLNFVWFYDFLSVFLLTFLPYLFTGYKQTLPLSNS